jgi:mRNA interferase RelE/StbE
MKLLMHSVPEKYLGRLCEPDKSRIKAALDGLKKKPQEGDVRPVTGQPGYFRLKIGNYRVLFRYREDDILITHIDPRGQSYRKKNKGRKR